MVDAAVRLHAVNAVEGVLLVRVPSGVQDPPELRATWVHLVQPCPRRPAPRLRPIVIRGARTHNLKNVDVTLAPRRLTVVTGVSGSGKSSLAFDTIYAEGQRRYVESLSAYARQFLERMERPDVDAVEGMPPAIAIRQKNSVRNPRSTVGTTTEIHDYLRLLFARVGRTVCRNCGRDVMRETAEAVADELGALPDGTRLLLGFEMPIVRGTTWQESDRETSEEGEGAATEETAPVAAASASAASARPLVESDPVRATLDLLRRKGFARRARRRTRRRPGRCGRRGAGGSIVARGDRRSRADRRRHARAPHRLDRDGLSRRRRLGVRDRSRGRRAPAGAARLQRALRVPAVRASSTSCRSRGCSRSTTRSAPARPVTASAT